MRIRVRYGNLARMVWLVPLVSYEISPVLFSVRKSESGLTAKLSRWADAGKQSSATLLTESAWSSRKAPRLAQSANDG